MFYSLDKLKPELKSKNQIFVVVDISALLYTSPRRNHQKNCQIDSLKKQKNVGHNMLQGTSKKVGKQNKYTKSLVNTNLFYTNSTNTNFQKVSIPPYMYYETEIPLLARIFFHVVLTNLVNTNFA